MIKTLSKSIRQYKKLSLLSPMFVIGEVIIEMLIPYLVGILIDNACAGAGLQDELFECDMIDICDPDQDIQVRDSFTCLIIRVCLP